MRFVSYGLTDVGLKRAHNEDNYVCASEIGLYVVADGMGGHAAGEVASSTAIDVIGEFIQQYRVAGKSLTWPFGLDSSLSDAENALITAVRLANRAVCNLATQNQAYGGMGTTIVGLLAENSAGAAVHVGDSRLYRLRGAELALLTMDHSWVNEQLQRNVISEEEAKSHRWRNVITRALGNNPELKIDAAELEFAPGDLYLLCSDGLSGMVADYEMERILRESGGDIELACETLVAQANANGGIDNATAILLRAE